MASNLVYKGAGSTLNGSEYNFIIDKVQSGTDSILTGSAVISGTTLKTLGPIGGFGSPTTWGQMVLAGSGITDAGSSLWVVFGTPFSAIPIVTYSNYNNGNFNGLTGSPITAGSVRILTSVASRDVSWIAVGPIGG